MVQVVDIAAIISVTLVRLMSAVPQTVVRSPRLQLVTVVTMSVTLAKPRALAHQTVDRVTGVVMGLVTLVKIHQIVLVTVVLRRHLHLHRLSRHRHRPHRLSRHRHRHHLSRPQVRFKVRPHIIQASGAIIHLICLNRSLGS